MILNDKKLLDDLKYFNSRLKTKPKKVELTVFWLGAVITAVLLLLAI